MTRGPGPDWNAQNYQTAFVIQDIGEVSGREAGFASLDGRGRALILDKFDNGLAAWTAGKSGSGLPPVVVSSSPVFIAPNAILLDPGQVTVGDISAITRLQALGKSTRLGLEAAFYNVGTNGARAFLQIQYNYNGTIYQARLRYNTANDTWTIQTPSGEVVIATQSVSNAYAQAKLVADFSTGKYVRMIIGENEYDISSYSIATTTAISLGTATYWFYAESRGASTTPLRLGYVLVTRDEP